MARRRRPDKLTYGLLAALALVAIITAILTFIVVRNLVNSWTMTELPGAPEAGAGISESPLEQLESGGPVTDNPLQEAGPTPQPWDGASRVNVLVVGLDYRDWEAGETPRTDTMILLTIDPLSKTAGMLSVPRDMWVNIPGFNYAKINTAYYLGEIYKMPGGGPALAMKTVEEFLGVPIQYYAQIDFYAFAKFIDTIGGLDLLVKEEIWVDPLGPGNTVKLEPGMQNIDGATILGFVRNRHTEGGDFDRSQRQQQVIMAIREQILTFNMLPMLIAKAPALYEELRQGIRTNLSLPQAIQLGVLATQIEERNIRRGVIGPPDMVIFGTSPDGLSIDIPVYDKIRLLRDEIFTAGGPVSPAAINSDPNVLMRDEQARVSVQNGTSVAGLATKTSEYFRSLGMNVIEETNAEQVYGASTIIIVNGKPNTVSQLAQLLNVSTGNILNRYDPDAPTDIIVIIGNDWANNNPMPQ